MNPVSHKSVTTTTTTTAATYTHSSGVLFLFNGPFSGVPVLLGKSSKFGVKIYITYIMLKISWKDKVPNTEVLKRVGEKEQQFSRNIVRMLDVLRGSSGRNALSLLILEGKIQSERAKGRPRRMWFDDVRQWTVLKEVKRNAEDREAWGR